jgi:WD40 repeat protein
MSLAALALHPSKPILVTASDDKSWKMWHLPHGDLVMCGEGHKDWVAGVDFHPGGTSLASASGGWLAPPAGVAAAMAGRPAAEAVLIPPRLPHTRSPSRACCCAGDSTVKVWDFEQQKCVLTLTDHKQAVWAARWHDLGEALASASLDHSVRLWDVGAGRCRQALRGHVDSVNDVSWQPFTNNLVTGA